MRKIVVELRPGDARGKAIVIFDDGVQVVIDREIVKKTGICVGREIDSDSLELSSIREDNYEKCYDAACVTWRSTGRRSEEELRRHLLLKRKFDSESVTSSIKEVNLT